MDFDIKGIAAHHQIVDEQLLRSELAEAERDLPVCESMGGSAVEFHREVIRSAKAELERRGLDG